jgi:hypothetical protein
LSNRRCSTEPECAAQILERCLSVGILVAGGGVFQTPESFFTGTFTSSEGAFTARGGVRALAGDRVTIGIDARVGWELHLRLNGLIGLRLGP